jgi:hypothetical protein
VRRRLEAAGYRVTLQRFTFPFFQELDSALQQTSPNQVTYETGAFTFSADGDVIGTVVPIDLVIPATPEPSSTSGCEPTDFPAAPAEPAIALIQRGTCTFEEKAAFAQAAGYDLDSVIAGPGINDSGTSTILEIAEEMAELGISNRQQLRFAFWGAEELGLLGSEHYVDSLSEEELQRIVANLNFDMVGSPNYVRFVYDGDGNGAPGNPDGPPGSAQIEALFNQYFAGQGLATEPTPFNGRSDYGPFIAVGIPAGGLFSGAEASRPPSRRPSTGAPPASPTTPATTRHVTTSPTSAPGP